MNNCAIYSIEYGLYCTRICVYEPGHSGLYGFLVTLKDEIG